MIRNPIYRPKGKAAEYADYALNIYTGCTNGCTYCYAPRVLRKTRDQFEDVKVREGLIEGLHKQLESGSYRSKTVHLCFTCDPYPSGIDTAPTREVIKELKAAGCHVQILTKNPNESMRDWDLLDSEDWIGTTITGARQWFIEGVSEEPFAEGEHLRLYALEEAKVQGFRTWVSCEPILCPRRIRHLIADANYIDLFKFGKLNYEQDPGIDYGFIGLTIEALCRFYDRNYLIKESLRKEMDKWDTYPLFAVGAGVSDAED